jgi:osmoprotectant transport system permease protein
VATLEFMLRNWREVLALVGQHLVLVLVSTSVAVLIGVPAGILLTRRPSLKRPVLGLANVLQTVPSLALFGLLIPIRFIGGVGVRTAIIALVLYALLPVIRNTVAGIEGVDRSVREAAVAMGMTGGQILRQVELPLALPVILAGVRVAAVICVGVATIAAAIGAGGLGTYIFRGLRMNLNHLILAGAIPAALIALAADWLIGLLSSRAGEKIWHRATRPGRSALRRRISWAALAVFVGLLSFALWHGLVHQRGSALVICSKDFTESIILAEILAQMCEARGLKVERSFELGGNLCHDALAAGRIDAYPEYTGTSYTAILHHQAISDPRAVYEQVKREYAERFGVEVSNPLGFHNDWAILVRGGVARRQNLHTISEAAPFAREWRAGFGPDFMSRQDGYVGFTRAYGLSFRAAPREMDTSLTYRALAAGEVDIIAGNSSDGLIAALDLTQLEDDRRYFPPYEAVFLYRRDSVEEVPTAREVIGRLAGAISMDEMRRLNYEVDGKRRYIAEVVREWRQGKGF